MIFNKRTFKRQDQLGLGDVIQDSVRSRSTANLKKFAEQYRFRKKMESYAKIFGGIIFLVILLLAVVVYFNPITQENSANNPIKSIDRNVFLRVNRIENWKAGAYNQLLPVGGNNYRVVLPLIPGEYEFKIADQDWTSPFVFGFEQEGSNLTLNQDFTLFNGENSQNIKLNIAVAGAYQFTLTVDLPNNFHLNCKKLDI